MSLPTETLLATAGESVAVAVANHGGKSRSVSEQLEETLTALNWNPAPSNATSRALILIDIGAFERESPVLPNRALVEHLIDHLATQGWVDIAIATSADSSSTWAENRDIAVLADLFGYCYETVTGTSYDILDLSSDLVDGGFPVGSVLANSALSRHWREANLRIVLAKAATDTSEGLVLSAQTLIAALPLRDKDLAYRYTMDTSEALALLLANTPPDLVLVDLNGIAHGSSGRSAPQRAETYGLVASRSLLAADAAAAAKLGADPAQSSLWTGLAARLGQPVLAVVLGDLTPLSGVRLADPLLVASTRARNRSACIGRLMLPWLQRIDTHLFPLKHPIDAKLQYHLTQRLADPDGDVLARTALLLLNQIATLGEHWLQAWQINYDKDRLPQRLAGISPATLAYGEADDRIMQQELDGLLAWLESRTSEPSEAPEAAVRTSAASDTALRWCRLNRTVVFSVVRDYPVSFKHFSAQVDISRTIQFMSDYLGGTILVRKRDAKGRPLRQVERNLYLPQPNYLAWWGGQPIDVSKIERLIHEKNRQRMYWKTIASENGSAQFDDGMVSFEALDASTTRVRIFGRQLFTLPPLLDAAHLEFLPELEDHLVEHAYNQFFAHTFANFEALLEGRSITIGKPPPDLSEVSATSTRTVETLAELTSQLANLLGPLLKTLVPSGRPRASTQGLHTNLGCTGQVGAMDSQGFVHFVPPPDSEAIRPPMPGAWWAELAYGYWGALRRDLSQKISPSMATHPEDQP